MKPGDGPIVLVLSPTRELAVQIKEECDKFGHSSSIKNTVVYGGVPKSRQVHTLRQGIEIVIATPGRLIDHLEQGNTNLKRVTYLGRFFDFVSVHNLFFPSRSLSYFYARFDLVMDEADRMLGKSFPYILNLVISVLIFERSFSCC